MKIWKIWLGSEEVPERFKQYTETWSKIEGGEIITVTDKNVHEWTGKTAFELADHFKGNIQVANHWVRYYLMWENGGIYLDLDVEVVRGDSIIWQNYIPTFGYESEGWINNHVMIACDSYYVFFELMSITWQLYDKFIKPEIDTGPGLVTRILKYTDENYYVKPKEYFSPWNWNEKPDRSRITENTLAVHHFTHSWKK